MAGDTVATVPVALGVVGVVRVHSVGQKRVDSVDAGGFPVLFEGREAYQP